MELVIIYGPPAVGKLTVAKELSKRTGYKLFHNHLTVDLVLSLIPMEDKRFWHMVDEHRVLAMEKAVQANIDGVIFTNCYVKGGTGTIGLIAKTLKKYKVRIHLVKLSCSTQTLKQRVSNRSRRAYKKINNVKALEQVLKKKDYFSQFPHPNTLAIDNTNISAKKVAAQIIRHFKLPSSKSTKRVRNSTSP
jgi:broad-specificity NMP kinase